MVELSLSALKEKMTSGCQVIDMRSPREFASGFIPGSIFFSEAVGIQNLSAFLKKNEPLIFLGNEKTRATVAKSFTASGFEIAGIYTGGMEEWTQAGNAIDLIIDVETDEFALDLRFDRSMTVVDLRSVEAYGQAHIPKAINIAVNELADLAQVASLDEEGCLYFYAAEEEISLMAASWLKKHGLHDLRVVSAGWNEISRESALEIEKAAKAK